MVWPATRRIQKKPPSFPLAAFSGISTIFSAYERSLPPPAALEKRKSKRRRTRKWYAWKSSYHALGCLAKHFFNSFAQECKLIVGGNRSDTRRRNASCLLAQGNSTPP